MTVKSLFGVLAVLTALLSPAPGADAEEIRISAAASLREPLVEVAGTFMKKNPGIGVITNFGGSGMLAKQVENGAPADIFIPANSEWMEYLQKRRLVDAGSVAILAYNELVFAGRPGTGVTKMKDLPRLERIAIGSPGSVPAGQYAVESMKKAGVEKQLEKRLVMAKDVREALMYAERGEVDGALVYRTDALRSNKVTILFKVPGEFCPQVGYPAALTAAGAAKPAAGLFVRYLRSPEAAAVFRNYGFIAR